MLRLLLVHVCLRVLRVRPLLGQAVRLARLLWRVLLLVLRLQLRLLQLLLQLVRLQLRGARERGSEVAREVRQCWRGGEVGRCEAARWRSSG